MQLGKYQLVRKLATGGMAEVYLAKAAGPMGFEKTLVLKRILPHLSEDPAFVEMFLGEAKLAAQLEHPNVVQIFDFGEADGSFFLAMELIDGPNLRKLVKRAQEVPLPPALCAKLVAFAAEGLAYAHEFRDPATGEPLGLIHRDVSPDNILVSRQGAVKVVDFGIAKVAGQGHRTQTGVVKGKVAYMPPEQLQTKPLDKRVDVYALGVVLYELLTGKRPFDATTDVSVMQAILFEPFIPAVQRRGDLPAALVQVLERALAKDRDKRYPDCRVLQADLERFVMSTGESVGAYQIAQFMAQVMADGAGGPVGVTPQSVAPRVQTGPKPATAPRSMVAPPEPPVDSTSPTTPMPISLRSGVGKAPRQTITIEELPALHSEAGAHVRSTVDDLPALGPAPRATVQERAIPASGRAPSSSRPRTEARPALGIGVARGRVGESWKPPEAVVMDAAGAVAPSAPVHAEVAAKVDADDAVHTRSAEFAAPQQAPKGSRNLVAVAVGGVLLAVGGAVVMFGSGSERAVPVTIKPLPEQVAPVEAEAARVPAAPAPEAVAAPVASPSGNSVAERAARQPVVEAPPQTGAPSGASESKPVVTPPSMAAPSTPVAEPVVEKNAATQAPPRPRPAARSFVVVAKGTLEFRIRPYAVVSLDGKVLGQTPLAAVEVPVGKHTLRLVNKELGKDVTKSVEVKADQPNVFKLNLEAE
ncbi:protein kinase domain-containing protein [Pyxidicoccus sp. MSG2]|uniref:protein kinase domain-containing protein n=1 Tax=Pyxidicoccus sp. MSG2 TaxID=2996790 RepID=UPI00226FC8B4|nr:protein kinase [Pyxidicoccus sp. MSG2]MCY1015340.1 protein kinase [Pyxidicoccus sp. MSG2]